MFSFPMDKSNVAGCCYLVKELCVLDSPYENEFFDPALDILLGVRSVAVAALPLLNSDLKIIGVLQVGLLAASSSYSFGVSSSTNHGGGSTTEEAVAASPATAMSATITGRGTGKRALSNKVAFTKTELRDLELFSLAAGSTISTARVLQHSIDATSKVKTLLNVAKLLGTETDTTSLIRILMTEAKTLLNCDKCSVFVVDSNTGNTQYTDFYCSYALKF